MNIFCKATEKYLNSDRDCFKKEIEREIDVIEDEVDMDMNSCKVYDYVTKFLPTKLIIQTRIPTQWENNEIFRQAVAEVVPSSCLVQIKLKGAVAFGQSGDEIVVRRHIP